MGQYLRVLLPALAILAPTVAAARTTPPQNSDLESPELGAAHVYNLSVDDAVALALQRSFKAARTARSLREKELRYGNAKAEYLPRLTTNVAFGQQASELASHGSTYSDQVASLSQFQGSANADLSMPLDVGGIIRRQVRQADLGRGIAADDVTNTELDVTLDVQTSYLSALRAQNNADADELVAKEIQDLLQRAGSQSPIASFLQVELANARQTAQTSRENSDNAQDSLKQLLRVPPETRLRLTSDFRDRKLPIEHDGLVQQALKNRPDMQSALLRVRQAQTTIDQVSDGRKPSVRLDVFASQQIAAGAAYEGRYDWLRQGGGLVNVSVPLAQWDNGELHRDKEAARLQREQADADVEELREKVAYDVRQQLLAVSRAENRIRNLPDPKQALRALQHAEQMLLSAPPETAQGLVAQVSNARQAWRSAETATADAYIDYNNAVFRLKRLIGDTSISSTTVAAGEIPVQTVGPSYGL